MYLLGERLNTVTMGGGIGALWGKGREGTLPPSAALVGGAGMVTQPSIFPSYEL